MHNVRRDDAGSLRHLITLDGLGRERIVALLDHAADLRERFRAGTRRLNMLEDRTIINLFFEPSTRTRISFELAARRLGAEVVNFDTGNSSTSKGESLEDTLHTLEAMDCDAFVVRHKEAGTAETLARILNGSAAILNAGDGNNAHPTQGLLDMLTIRDKKGTLEGLTVVICGDILHSRVARSDIHALCALGASEIRLCGPAALLPPLTEFPQCRIFENFDDALPNADAIIMLRLQKERMQQTLVPTEAAYFSQYGLTSTRLRRANPKAIVLHPGPINRGVEIASDIADGPQSVILDQVSNGIFIRMAVLIELLSQRPISNEG